MFLLFLFEVFSGVNLRFDLLVFGGENGEGENHPSIESFHKEMSNNKPLV